MDTSTALHPHKTSEPKEAQNSALTAAVIATCLAVIKLALYFVTGSLVVAHSAFDSFMDAVISFINRKVISFARTDADADHPYGHGKAESLAALSQGTVIIGGALSIIVTGFLGLYKFFAVGNFEKPALTYWAALFFLLTACISVGLTLFLKKAGRKHKSPALLGDAEHYRTDVISNIGGAAAISVVILTDLHWIDPLLAIIFAGFMLKGGYDLAKKSVDELMDKDIDNALKQQMLNEIFDVSEDVLDVHKFRGRVSGHRLLIDLHITLPNHLSFQKAHEIADAVEQHFLKAHNADATIHIDPEDQ